jgi:uncharacterized protein DUF4440
MANVERIDSVKEAENILLNAQVRRDRKALEDIISDDYVGVNPDGTRVSKREEIENMLSTNYSSGEIVDLVVNFYGETAVATGQMILGSDAVSHRFSFTDVYLNQKLVACQANLLV